MKIEFIDSPDGPVLAYKDDDGVTHIRTPKRIEKATMPHVRLSDGVTIMPDGTEVPNDK